MAEERIIGNPRLARMPERQREWLPWLRELAAAISALSGGATTVTISVNGSPGVSSDSIDIRPDEEISVRADAGVTLYIGLVSLDRKFRRLLLDYVEATGRVPAGLEDDLQRATEEPEQLN